MLYTHCFGLLLIMSVNISKQTTYSRLVHHTLVHGGSIPPTSTTSLQKITKFHLVIFWSFAVRAPNHREIYNYLFFTKYKSKEKWWTLQSSEQSEERRGV